jgi:hypothetical protein
MADVTKTPTLIVEGNIYGAGSLHWSDIEDMDICGVGAGNISGAVAGYVYTPICTDFDFAIPSGNVITKIEVFITGQQDGTTYLDWCSLMYNSTPSPMTVEAADIVNPLDATSHAATLVPHGDPNLWGQTWTVAMINDPTFGVAFDGYHNSGDTIQIDCVQIKVTYEAGEEPDSICDGLGCTDGFMDLPMAIKSIIGKLPEGVEAIECTGLKTHGHLAKCTDLTDLTACGTRYTLEQALKSALVNDGCDGWALRIWVLPRDGRPV